MSEAQIRDCTDPAVWWPHVDEAVHVLAKGGLAVIPTDTVYGIAADAFTPEAVTALLAAKGRGRQMPPPVLIGDVRTLEGLATDVPDAVRKLVAAFWPGPLTVIVTAQPSLRWDLGDTNGTVALRMPDDECALALLRRTGPLAVSSANLTGSPAALTAAQAAEQLGDSVRIYLDGGPAKGAVASTIVDATGDGLRIVREGALSAAQLGAVVPALMPPDEQETEGEAEPDTAAAPDAESDTASAVESEVAAESAAEPAGEAEVAAEPEPESEQESDPAAPAAAAAEEGGDAAP